MAADPYESFAERYDLFQLDPSLPDREVRGMFFRDLFEASGIESVLDCACGTGEDLILLHSLGVEVWGSDISEAMLAVASAKEAIVDASIPLFRADFRKLPEIFDRTFDAVVCLSTSLPHLLDEADIVRALRSMREVLSAGGVLVLSQGISDRMMTERPRFIPSIQTRDFSRIFVVDYGDDALIMNVLDIVHSEVGTGFEVDSFPYRMIGQAGYERLLTAAGFAGAEFFGTWEGDPYDPAASHHLIVVARR